MSVIALDTIAKAKINGIEFVLMHMETSYDIQLGDDEYTRLVDLLGKKEAEEKIDALTEALEKKFYQESIYRDKANQLGAKIKELSQLFIETPAREDNFFDTFSHAGQIIPKLPEFLQGTLGLNVKTDNQEGQFYHLNLPIANYIGIERDSNDTKEASADEKQMRAERKAYADDDLQGAAFTTVLSLSKREQVAADFVQMAAAVEQEMGGRSQPDRMIRVGEGKLRSLMKEAGLPEDKIQQVIDGAQPSRSVS